MTCSGDQALGQGLTMILIAPLLEELVFRGFVLRIMQSVWSRRSAILANAFLTIKNNRLDLRVRSPDQPNHPF